LSREQRGLASFQKTLPTFLQEPSFGEATAKR
jgi:hypothetical protein